MALNSENDMIMPVTPMGNGNGGGFGDFGGNSGWWILLLFLLIGNNGWGNGNGGGNWNGGGFAPYMADAGIQRGFDQSAIMSGINGITGDMCNGFAGVQQSLCNGFAGMNQNMANGFANVNQTISGGFAGAEIAANGRQIANMQQAFNAQTAIDNRLDGIAMNQQQCCCDTRANIADLRYTVATEACADRAAVNDALQAVTAQNNANTQRILDQLCQDKIDAKNDEIANLRQQLNMASLAASQNAQTAQILTDNLAQTNALEQYLAPVPRPAYIVQNPNGCSPAYNNGCGCG